MRGLLPELGELVGNDGTQAVAPGVEVAVRLTPAHHVRRELLNELAKVWLHRLASPFATARQLHSVDNHVLHVLSDSLVGGHTGPGSAEDDQWRATAAGRREADHAGVLAFALLLLVVLHLAQKCPHTAVLGGEEDQVGTVAELRDDAGAELDSREGVAAVSDEGGVDTHRHLQDLLPDGNHILLLVRAGRLIRHGRRIRDLLEDLGGVRKGGAVCLARSILREGLQRDVDCRPHGCQE
mmetsp:Transcript_13270/g.34202  ORF Transcript_13270/g.34202 Transcript_13270/m.34202 type:complete len:239 (+) Transcript_13270:1614-2330(+)